jgi:hypothetical protein
MWWGGLLDLILIVEGYQKEHMANIAGYGIGE